MGLTILYGSETGTAEDVAFSMGLELKILFHEINILSMDDYEISRLSSSERLIIFVVSTTGDGDAPMNMKNFWKHLLRKDLPSNILNELKIAIFGLGDSSYEKFNAASRRLNTRLHQLGATDIIPIGLGDDQARYGYFSALTSWQNDLIRQLKDYYAKSSQSSNIKFLQAQLQQSPQSIVSYSSNENNHNITNIARSIGEEVYDIKIMNSTTTSELSLTSITKIVNNNMKHEHLERRLPFQPPPNCHFCNGTEDLSRSYFIGKVVENSRLTSPDCQQDVRHIRLSLTDNFGNNNSSKSRYKSPYYSTGDVAVIQPCNNPNIVTRALSLFPSIPSDALLSISSKSTTMRISNRRRIHNLSNCTLTELLTRYLNISGLPLRSFFSKLSLLASNEEQKDKLFELSTGEGTDLYYDYCVREKRNYIDILEDFPSVFPLLTLSRLCELIPLLPPRYYSIASSAVTYPDEIHLCVAVTQYTSPRRRKVVTGLCSGYLRDLSLDDTVVLWVRAGAFTVPSIRDSPLIMVGPGTGVAPLRGILQDRVAQNTDWKGIVGNVLSASEGTQGSEKKDRANSCIEVDTPHITAPAPVEITPNTTTNIPNTLEMTNGTTSMTTTTTASVNNKDLRKTMLFVGCRHKSQDYLYANEWQEILTTISSIDHLPRSSTASFSNNNYSTTTSIETHTNNNYIHIIPAFSQDQVNKVYVTHQLLENGGEVYQLLMEGAFIFVSGSAKKMPSDVRKTFRQILQLYSGGHFDVTSAEQWLKRLEKEKKYIVDVWS